MRPTAGILLIAALAALAAPPVIGLHTDPGQPGGANVTSFSGSAYVQLATPVWWDHSTVHGVPTGLSEQTLAFHLSSSQEVLLEAWTVSRTYDPYPDPKGVCGLTTLSDVIVPAPAGHAVVWNGPCVKSNAATVQIHFFQYVNTISDRDHIVSPTPNAPLATTNWHVDAVATDYKHANIPPGEWEVWIDPAVGVDYDIMYTFTAGGNTFYLDYMGWRGCVFYASVNGVQDEQVIGCPEDYADNPGPSGP